MKTLALMIFLITSIGNSFAQNAVTLNEGDITPFKGILVTSEKMKELIKADKKVPLLEAKFDAQNDLIDYHKGMAREARGKLLGEQISGNMKLIGGFVLGVLITSLTLKVTQEINR